MSRNCATPLDQRMGGGWSIVAAPAGARLGHGDTPSPGLRTILDLW